MARIYGSTSLGRNYSFFADISETNVDKDNNQSTVKYEVYVQNGDRRTDSNGWTFNAKIDGSDVYNATGRNLKTNDVDFYAAKKVFEGTKVIGHNTDGSKTISFSAKLSKSSYSSFDPGECNLSGNVTLTKIDRYPMLTNAPNFNDEGNPTIQYTTALGFSGASVQACIANSTGSVIYVPYREVNVSNGSYTFNLTPAERTALRNATPNSNLLNIRFYLRTTTTGGTQYFSYLDKQLSIVNADPTATYTELETNARVSAILGTSASTVIQNASVVRYTITPTALKGSSITSVIVKHNNINYQATLSSGNYVVDIPIVTNTLQIYVKDSRGNPTNNSATVNITKTMITYYPVDLRAYDFKRVNATSSDINISMESIYYQATFGETQNTPTIRYKLGDGDFVTIPDTEYTIDTTNNTISVRNFLVSDILPYTSAGTFTIQIDDLLSTDIETQNVTKGIPTFDAGETDLKVNGQLYIAGTDGVVIGEIRDLIYPVHSVYASTSSTNPSSILGGAWSSIGSATVGSTTVYYFEKTDAYD